MRPVTFRRLERLGRIGNQCWQIVSTLGIAERHGYTPVFPRWTYAPYFRFPEEIWVDDVPPSALDVETLPDLDIIAERHRGYLQDRSLWADIEDKVRFYMQPSELALQILHATAPWFFEIPPADRVAVHIRRGDAITAGPKLYPLQSPMYVENALQEMRGVVGEVLLFTDDPNWVHIHLGHLGRVITGNADWADLQLMAMCDRLAIANSSFSYWAAASSSARIVCYPNTWYGPLFKDLSHMPMIPPEWIGINDPRAGRVP